jgi:hypothetical protein
VLSSWQLGNYLFGSTVLLCEEAMTIVKMLLPAIAAASLTVALAADAPRDDSKKKEPPTEKEIKALIDQLASPNPKPIVNKRKVPGINLPPGFDRKKQDKVHLARSKLAELGPQAFPFLIDSWKDERYSLTTCNGLSGWFYNESVGHICQTILFGQLQPYGFWPAADGDPRGKPHRPDYPVHFLNSQEAAKAWWEKNKEKTLYQIQLEALDWVIAEETKRPGDFTDKEKQSLQKLRKRLVEGGKPLPPGHYYARKISYRD